MYRTLSLLTLFVASTAFAGDVSATAAFTEPFHFTGTFFNACTNEEVAFELDCRFVANSNPGSDQFHQQCHGTATGLTTGSDYQMSEVFRFRDNIDFAACHGSAEIQDEWHLISQGSLPNESVGFRERCTASVYSEELCLFTCVLLDFGLPKCRGK